jgi:hypothetical protein
MQRCSTIAILPLIAAALIGATGCTAPAKTPRPRTFGVSVEESEEPVRIVYLIDGGEYMMGSIGAIKYELKRSIGELPDAKKFQVIFYSASTTEIPGSEPVPATDKNKQEAFRLIDDYVPGDGADPTVGLERAFACRPDVICFLAGAELPSSLIELVKRLNVNKRTCVHTIRFLWRFGDDAVLRKIAEDSGGGYKFVTEDDLDEFIRRGCV